MDGVVFMKSRKSLKSYTRKLIFEKDNFTCKICGIKPNIIPENYTGTQTIIIGKVWLELDHIVSFKNGGKCDANNFQTLCNVCNSKKSWH